MALPAPNLDDRRFQDLVDEAKRRVQQSCPEWTDHNVSDPGVTLIETFAYMVDELLYRLNRVPELHYLRFLDLIGVRLFPPTPAHCDVTFWLAAAREEPVVVRAGTQVSSLRSEVEEPVVFTVERDLTIVPSRLAYLSTSVGTAAPLDRTDELGHGGEVACFATPPAVGDAVLFGLPEAVPGCAVLLRMSCRAEGVGVDPTDPPMIWEAWDGNGWAACEVDHDTTGAFNRDGDVVLHVPPSHTAVVLGQHRAGWLRCRLVAPEPDQRFFSASPRLREVAASTIGGTVPAVHADIIREEMLGIAEGVPGQRFALSRRPVVAADAPLVVEVSGPDGWQPWREVESFAASDRADRHVMLDRMAGEVVFGPAIRLPDGTLKYYGAVPAKGAAIRVSEYRTGGGMGGNVARGLLQVQRDPVPFVSSVINRRPATGGVDGESVRDAALRGPLLLRTRDRAVTAEDYEQLAREAAPEAARVRCIAADQAGEAVRVLVVPAVPDPVALEFATLKPDVAMLARITEYLDERRCLGARISVEPPYYRGVTVVAKIQAKVRTAVETLRTRATAALYAYLNPVTGGPDGTGWPFGRPVQSGEIFAVLQRVPGVELVEDVRLFAADPITGERGGAVQRIDLPPHALVFSYGHQVRADRGT
jgi:predicted phage baseplate assembly protein